MRLNLEYTRRTYCSQQLHVTMQVLKHIQQISWMLEKPIKINRKLNLTQEQSDKRLLNFRRKKALSL